MRWPDGPGRWNPVSDNQSHAAHRSAVSSCTSSFHTRHGFTHERRPARTTLHKTAPLQLFSRQRTFLTSAGGFSTKPFARGTLICFTTRRSFASPMCVCVCQCRKADHVSQVRRHRDGFQPPVLGAQQQCAVVVQRFGAAAKLAPADLHRHVPANCDAAFFPFVTR